MYYDVHYTNNLKGGAGMYRLHGPDYITELSLYLANNPGCAVLFITPGTLTEASTLRDIRTAAIQQTTSGF